MKLCKFQLEKIPFLQHHVKRTPDARFAKVLSKNNHFVKFYFSFSRFGKILFARQTKYCDFTGAREECLCRLPYKEILRNNY